MHRQTAAHESLRSLSSPAEQPTTESGAGQNTGMTTTNSVASHSGSSTDDTKGVRSNPQQAAKVAGGDFNAKLRPTLADDKPGS